MKKLIVFLSFLFVSGCISFTYYQIVNRHCRYYPLKISNEMDLTVSGGFYKDISYSKFTFEFSNSSRDTVKFVSSENYLTSKNYKFNVPYEDSVIFISPYTKRSIEIYFLGEKLPGSLKKEDTLTLRIQGFMLNNRKVSLKDIDLIDTD